MKKKLIFGILTAMVVIFMTPLLQQCRKDRPAEDPTVTDTPVSNPLSDINNTLGFGLLSKIKGIWNGPVSSTTPLGSYPEWIVDFRPISENQISAKNELDKSNDIHMSFFIAKYKNEYRICFRNGGSFGGQTRVSYLLCDSVSEKPTHSYYRFSEIIKGKSRAYTEVIFTNDSLIMKSYTNHYNTLTVPTLHMAWTAKLQDSTSCIPAVSYFGFPKKTLTKDFSSTFTGQTEAIYYTNNSNDPYTEAQQPYLGKAIINYTYAGTYTPDPNKKTFIIITTQPLINGFFLNAANLKYRSRYVILSATDQSYVFNYMHPGTYYLYAFYDTDGNKNFSSGDWVSTTNTTFTLTNQGTVTSGTQINFTIP
ncbi:MAG: hypothetical protein N3F09_10565 [Bacteroidia bacterium]|nr:hypothetical protein [Bacteroidia bacterium]